MYQKVYNCLSTCCKFLQSMINPRFTPEKHNSAHDQGESEYLASVSCTYESNFTQIITWLWQLTIEKMFESNKGLAKKRILIIYSPSKG